MILKGSHALHNITFSHVQVKWLWEEHAICLKFRLSWAGNNNTMSEVKKIKSKWWNTDMLSPLFSFSKWTNMLELFSPMQFLGMISFTTFVKAEKYVLWITAKESQRGETWAVRKYGWCIISLGCYVVRCLVIHSFFRQCCEWSWQNK